eukprot:s777_g15.t1
MQDARRVDAAGESTKRPAEVPTDDLRAQTGDAVLTDTEAGGEAAESSQPNVEAHDAMVLTREELVQIAADENKDVHPLMKVQALAALDMLDPASAKEYKWPEMKEADKPAYREAAKKGWGVWTENGAVDLLTKEASERVVASLRARGELYRLLQPRWVFTDKNDGIRTKHRSLPVQASARLVVPGYRDLEA